MRHCNIAPLHQLGICDNNITDVCMYVCMSRLTVTDLDFHSRNPLGKLSHDND